MSESAIRLDEISVDLKFMMKSLCGESKQFDEVFNFSI